ncbi:phosphoribosylglycinamide formyltransferase [Bacillaceae bacterium Marseille-Q3522]|nr:phosphoribosylglycinamide formyltransferase [Bacillaceae bacterium Marseille-Q3522]
MKKLAVFASGNGTNFQVILDAAEQGRLHASVELLVSDQLDAFAIKRAESAGIPCFVFSAKQYSAKAAYEEEILVHLKEKQIDFIVLTGYMRLIGSTILQTFQGRIVNIHPSLLPAFPGKDAIGQAIAAGVKVSGVTIHYVDEGMDTGPIIAQQAVEIAENETKTSLQQKIQHVEHQLYPQVLEKICR